MRNLTSDQLAAELVIDKRTVLNYAKAGCPCDAPKKKGGAYRFDRGEVAAWMQTQRRTGKVGRPVAETSEQIKAAQLRVLLAKAESAEIELQRTKGDILQRSEVEAGNIARITCVRDGLLALPGNVAARVAGMQSPQDIEATLDKAVRDLLAVFAQS